MTSFAYDDVGVGESRDMCMECSYSVCHIWLVETHNGTYIDLL